MKGACTALRLQSLARVQSLRARAAHSPANTGTPANTKDSDLAHCCCVAASASPRCAGTTHCPRQQDCTQSVRLSLHARTPRATPAQQEHYGPDASGRWQSVPPVQRGASRPCPTREAASMCDVWAPGGRAATPRPARRATGRRQARSGAQSPGSRSAPATGEQEPARPDRVPAGLKLEAAPHELARSMASQEERAG